jgi:hypothetical protein
MNESRRGASAELLQLSWIERVLALLDLVIGVPIIAMAAWMVLSLFWSSDSSDNVVVGGLGIALLLPFGLAALAAFDGMRTRAKGRWMLQVVALIPPLFMGYLLVFR